MRYREEVTARVGRKRGQKMEGAVRRKEGEGGIKYEEDGEERAERVGR